MESEGEHSKEILNKFTAITCGHHLVLIKTSWPSYIVIDDVINELNNVITEFKDMKPGQPPVFRADRARVLCH